MNATLYMNMRLQDIPFDTRKTIRQIKEQLEGEFGTSVRGLNLKLRDNLDQSICVMDDDNQQLRSYRPQNDYTIHIGQEMER